MAEDLVEAEAEDLAAGVAEDLVEVVECHLLLSE